MICGLVSIVLVPAIRKDGGPAIFAQTRIGKNGRHFTFINLDQCVLMLRIKKERIVGEKYYAGGMFKMDNDSHHKHWALYP